MVGSSHSSVPGWPFFVCHGVAGRHYPSGADRGEEQRSNLLTLRSSALATRKVGVSLKVRPAVKQRVCLKMRYTQ